ncbi:MAG: hypothetical protein VW268_14745 [Rhodospirillaceae bacterium]
MQTAAAAEQLSNSIAEIGRLVSRAAGISDAVEEQDAATRDIAAHVEQAATGASEVTRNITFVTQGA